MKKIFNRLVVTMLAITLLVPFMLPMTAQASSGSCGEVMSWSLDSSGALTISGVGEMTDYTAGTAPWGTGITQVTIKGNVTSIGDYAFYNCTKLTSALVADTVTTIGVAAFKGCTALSSLQPLDAAADPFIGDVNCDGSINLLDALILLKYDSNMDVLIADYNADINNDGKIDIQDILALLQYAAGWDVENLPTDLSALLRMVMAQITPCSHTGRTQLTGAIEATLEQEGYTGDLYCLECGDLIEKGTTLPKLIELPVTGDSGTPLLWLALLVLSAGVFLLIQRRNRVKQQ